MNNKEVQSNYLVSTYPNRNLTLVRGEGVYVFDEDENAYLDCMSNYGVNMFGYGNQELLRPIKQQIDTLSNLHCSFSNPTRSQALEKLTEVLPESLTRMYLGNSGTEAIEAAIKFAYTISGRQKFIAAQNGYHGKTLGALAATTSNDGAYQRPVAGLLSTFDLVEFGSIKSLERTISKEHAAVILEPVQGEGGIITATGEYFQAVRRLCDQYGVILIFDEIQTGMGRTGKLFSYEHDNIVPDMICLGKGAAAGMPVGITVIQKDLAENIPRGLHTSTFGGNPVASAGIIATLDFISRHHILDHVVRTSEHLRSMLKTIDSPIIKEIRGKGLMVGIELSEPATPYIRQLQKKKILVSPAGDSVIRILPPLTITQSEVDILVKGLQRCFR